jgi:hypothetical protein
MIGMKLAAATVVVVVLGSSAALADGPPRVTCSHKTFPNIQGQNAVTLARQANGSYTASYEARSEQELRFPLDACKVTR